MAATRGVKTSATSHSKAPDSKTKNRSPKNSFSQSRLICTRGKHREFPCNAVGLVIPTLLSWDESAVIYDIKGENYAKMGGFRFKNGHICFKFSPVKDGS